MSGGHESEAPLAALWREPAGEPAGALVLLHGRGADERDLFPLLDLLDPERRLLGVTPGGPHHLPPGGRHWYALGGIPTPDPATFAATAPRLAAFLDGLPVPMRPRRARRLLAGDGDELRDEPRPRPAAAGGPRRHVRIPAAGRGLAARARAAPRRPGRASRTARSIP